MHPVAAGAITACVSPSGHHRMFGGVMILAVHLTTPKDFRGDGAIKDCNAYFHAITFAHWSGTMFSAKFRYRRTFGMKPDR